MVVNAAAAEKVVYVLQQWNVAMFPTNYLKTQPASA
jgi:hypothetical protein